MTLGILTAGTRGDVQPLLSLAWALQRRGRDVLVGVPDNFVSICDRAGIPALGLGIDAAAIMAAEVGQRALARGDVLAFLRMLEDANRSHAAVVDERVRTIAARCGGLLAGSLMVEHAAVVREATGVPLATAHVFPIVPTAAWAHPLLPVSTFGLGWLNRGLGNALTRLAQRRGRPEIDAFRASYGLGGATHSGLEASYTGPDPVLNAFSGRVVPRPPDWGDPIKVTGWWRVPPELRAALGEDRIDGALEAWLDAGPPPVFFGFGSMPVLDPARFLGLVRDVSASLGVRALVGAGWSALQGGDERDLFVAPSFDHSRVLPRCRAAVHHGGSHTTFASLSAGLPTHVAAVMADQPYWGRRVTALGVGGTSAFKAMNEDSLRRAVEALLRPEVAERATTLAAQLAEEDGLGEAVKIVEAWFFGG